MVWLQLLPVALSLLLLAAHFLRSGDIVLVAVILLLLALLSVRRRWAARAVQVALLFGAAEWVRTLISLVTWRLEVGQPVLRLVLILGGVALLTALSAVIMRSARLQKWYAPS